MWLRQSGISVGFYDAESFVTVSGLFPAPDQDAQLMRAVVDQPVLATPWGPRLVFSVTATDGPEGWTVELMTPPTFMMP